jgi:hypothetical protein
LRPEVAQGHPQYPSRPQPSEPPRCSLHAMSALSAVGRREADREVRGARAWGTSGSAEVSPVWRERTSGDPFVGQHRSAMTDLNLSAQGGHRQLEGWTARLKVRRDTYSGQRWAAVWGAWDWRRFGELSREQPGTEPTAGHAYHASTHLSTAATRGGILAFDLS